MDGGDDAVEIIAIFMGCVWILLLVLGIALGLTYGIRRLKGNTKFPWSLAAAFEWTGWVLASTFVFLTYAAPMADTTPTLVILRHAIILGLLIVLLIAGVQRLWGRAPIGCLLTTQWHPKSQTDVPSDIGQMLGQLRNRSARHRRLALLQMFSMLGALVFGVAVVLWLTEISDRQAGQREDMLTAVQSIASAHASINDYLSLIKSGAPVSEADDQMRNDARVHQRAIAEIDGLRFATQFTIERCQTMVKLPAGAKPADLAIEDLKGCQTALQNMDSIKGLTSWYIIINQFSEALEQFPNTLVKVKSGTDEVLKELITRVGIIGLILLAIQVLGSLYRYNMAMAAKYDAVADAVGLYGMQEPGKLAVKSLEDLIPAVNAAQDDLFKGKQLLDHFTEIFGKVIERVNVPGMSAGKGPNG